MSKKTSDPKTREKFREWIRENIISTETVEYVDIEAEFGSDLSYDEAIRLAIRKFPGIWKVDPDSLRDSKPNKIIFVKELVGKISDGKIQVTYRKSPKVGLYYVIENRFRQKPDSARLLIEFYRTDRVNPYELTNGEALLAGIDSAQQIRNLFEKWYGSPLPYSSGTGFEY
jgi:hypothetical protein